jgi:hypothetical protein
VSQFTTGSRVRLPVAKTVDRIGGRAALDQAEAIAAQADDDYLLLRLSAGGKVIAYSETTDRRRLHHRLMTAIDLIWHDAALIACSAGACDCHCRDGAA